MADAQRCLDILKGLSRLADRTPLAEADVNAIFTEVANHADEDPEDFIAALPGPVPPAGQSWTVGALRDVLRALAAQDATSFETMLMDIVARANVIVTGRAQQFAEAREEIDRMRRERLFPDGPGLDRVMRYEANLNRWLYHAVNQLESSQQRRAGNVTPLARVQIYGLPGS